jgi:hypothetical protein
MTAEPLLNTHDTWYKVDEHPAVLAGAISRDQAYAAARQGRCRTLWLSKRSLRVHRDLLDDLSASGKP